MNIDKSELQKIHLALVDAAEFFVKRDEMNAKVHLGTPVWSPITSVVINARNRAKTLLEGGQDEES